MLCIGIYASMIMRESFRFLARENVTLYVGVSNVRANYKTATLAKCDGWLRNYSDGNGFSCSDNYRRRNAL